MVINQIKPDKQGERLKVGARCWKVIKDSQIAHVEQTAM